MIYTEQSPACAGLAGNPSDACFGRCLAMPVPNWGVEVTLYESPEMLFLASTQDHVRFASLRAMSEELDIYGYYGGVRLLKAATKVFLEACEERGIAPPERRFTVRYQSDVPRRVGLGESSAACTAMLRALVRFYEVDLPLDQLPLLAWRIEHEELGVPCGLMARVVQTFGETTYMDLQQERIETQGCGDYQPLASTERIPFFLAVPDRPTMTPSDYHRSIGIHVEEHRPDVLDAMTQFANFATRARDAFERSDLHQLGTVMDANFDLRCKTFRLPKRETDAVQTCREHGAHAKLASGGGTLVGLLSDHAASQSLSAALTDQSYTLANVSV